MLRQALLLLARSQQVKEVVTRLPVSSDIVNRYVPGEDTDHAVEASRVLIDGRPARDARLPGRGHPRRGAGRGHRGGLPRPARGAQPRRAGAQRRGEREAVRDRAGAARDRSQAGHRERSPHLSRGPQRRHHGDPRHGGPHHHRRHARDAARAAQGLPGDRRRAAGLPAPHRAGLPRAGARGQPGPALQGRLQRARGSRLPGTPRRRQVLRALPEDPDGGRGLPDGGHPRPAPGQDRLGAGHPQRPDARHLRVPDALRDPHRRAEAARRHRREGARLRALRRRSGTAT